MKSLVHQIFYKKNIIKLAFGISGGSVISNYFSNNTTCETLNNKQYTYEEIEKHNNVENGIWVTYKDGVYDITNFVKVHPGGSEKIMMAAGKSVDPYWNIYTQHEKNDHLLNKILPNSKIGTISNYDPNKYENFVLDEYVNEPIRKTDALKYHTTRPCNAETKQEHILNDWYTPNDDFFIRNHYPVPVINEKDYTLTIEGLGVKKTVFTLEDLKTKFRKHQVTSSIMCGGNRRGGLNELEKTLGTGWGTGAIGNAKWGGVLLSDVIKYCVVDNENNSFPIDRRVEHVQFDTLDTVATSIPIDKAMNPYGETILCWEMNDEDLPRDHGWPIRVIVPGYVGIRNTKWISKITLSDQQKQSRYQIGLDYKLLPPQIKDTANVDLSKIPPMLEQTVNSVIISPQQNEIIDTSKNLEIFGWAYSGGGRGITRVDVSLDGGKNWQLAELLDGKDQKFNRAWAWTWWKLSTPIPHNIDKNNIQLVCKAIDAGYNVQPHSPDIAWNIRGINNNTWFKINVKGQNPNDNINESS